MKSRVCIWGRGRCEVDVEHGVLANRQAVIDMGREAAGFGPEEFRYGVVVR